MFAHFRLNELVKRVELGAAFSYFSHWRVVLTGDFRETQLVSKIAGYGWFVKLKMRRVLKLQSMVLT
jgi:hypothetical protein